ncbi:HAD-IIIC family phosphatase, partial [Nocardia cyriacigeorgica]|uniref:HAD-IIIC family phosphatase n=1 Tax=Nocardia cyriacigeorgica TaxID=135487 RepID=UPI002457BF11
MQPALRCLVWELDNTLWDGVVYDGTAGALDRSALRTLRVLSERGMWHAVASRGDRTRTTQMLRRHGLHEMFSVVEIGWGRKSSAIVRISHTLGLRLDSIGFVDPEPVERAEVARALPLVRCYAARNAGMLLNHPDFRPVVRPDRDPTPPLGVGGGGPPRGTPPPAGGPGGQNPPPPRGGGGGGAPPAGGPPPRGGAPPPPPHPGGGGVRPPVPPGARGVPRAGPPPPPRAVGWGRGPGAP